jgi:hypothetical protein
MESPTGPMICSKSKCKNPLPPAIPGTKYFKTCERCRNRDRLTEAARRKKQQLGIGCQEPSRDTPITISGRDISDGDTGSDDDESESESVSRIVIFSNDSC